MSDNRTANPTPRGPLVTPDHRGKCSLCKRITMVETCDVDPDLVVELLAKGVPSESIRPQNVCLRCANSLQRQFEQEDAAS